MIVSNYPGTTVEVLEGRVRHYGHEVRVVDLPGICSLGVVSEDALVARRAILELKLNVIANIVDASNLERGLYLTLQLLDLDSFQSAPRAVEMWPDASSRLNS